MNSDIDYTIRVLGVSLILAFIMGKVAHRIKIPKVTVFILIGLFLGPSVFKLITPQFEEDLRYLNDIALGLILFNIGGEFHQELFKKIGWKMVRFGFVYCILASTLVFIICMCTVPLTGLSIRECIFFSSFLGTIAISSAPPTTLIVIKEYDSKGNLTDHIIVILAISTVMAIVGSQVVTIFFEWIGFFEVQGDPLNIKLLNLLWSIIGSMILGTLLGLGLSYLEQREKSSSEVLLAVVSTILLGITLSHYLKLESLLVSIFLGFSLVNFSQSGDEIHKHIKGVGLSIYALFFIFAGAHIDVYNMKSIGIMGIIYIVARTISVNLSSIISAKLLKEEDIKGNFLGISLLSHGGVALGIVAGINYPEQPVVKMAIYSIVSSVFFFEIMGPIMLRFALIKSREVKVGTLIGDTSTSTTLTLVDMIKLFLTNIGILHKTTVQDAKNIKSLANRKIYAIDAKATFGEVVKYIDEHHFPIYPVVNSDYKYEGMINLSELKSVMFDGFLSRFVVGRDLIGHRYSIPDDATIDEAIELFNESKLEALPIVHPETKKLTGILLHKNVIMAKNKEG